LSCSSDVGSHLLLQALRHATKCLQTADESAGAVAQHLGDAVYLKAVDSSVAMATQAVGDFEEQLCVVARLIVFGDGDGSVGSASPIPFRRGLRSYVRLAFSFVVVAR
jgi:hypothetical protein